LQYNLLYYPNFLQNVKNIDEKFSWPAMFSKFSRPGGRPAASVIHPVGQVQDCPEH
jgi:hypothetical protein